MGKLKAERLMDAMGPKVKTPVFTDEVIRYGSMYFSVSNLGGDHLLPKGGPKCKGDIARAYQQEDMACAEATGEYEGGGAEPERKWWETCLRHGRGKTSKERTHDKNYFRAQLMKECPFLFEEKP